MEPWVVQMFENSDQQEFVGGEVEHVTALEESHTRVIIEEDNTTRPMEHVEHKQRTLFEGIPE